MSAVNLVLVISFLIASGAAARALNRNTAVEPVQHTGRKFDFQAEGGAKAFMAQLAAVEPQKLERIMQKAAAASIGGETLVHALNVDDSLGIDLDEGLPMYQCPGVNISDIPGIKLDPNDLAIGGQDLLAGDPDPLAPMAFDLRSRESATKKIFLNFRGGFVTGTAWNKNSPNITVPPFDFDGNPSSFSDLERNAIVAVWRQVAEDYAPFDVDVTTIRPPSFKNNMHVMIGGDGAWYGSAGGVAYVNVFGQEKYQPAFIFPKNLGPDYPKFIGEAISHEVGHTLGLLHDGDDKNPYFTGQGEWAPIMGIGYYKQVTQFDRGEFPNANNQQDDIQVISNYLPILQQAAGSTVATATPITAITMTGAVATANISGIVSQPGVPQFYSFLANAGIATVTVEVTGAWEDFARSNLDAQAIVYDSNGAQVGPVINPTGYDTRSGLGISAAPVVLPAPGTYYVAVSGSGSGDPRAEGYSNYGSRGKFILSVSYTPQGVDPGTPTASPSPDMPSPAPEDPNNLNSASPTPENPDGSTDPGQQTNPDQPSPSPQPLPIEFSLLSQFPEGFTPPSTPEISATGDSDFCIQSNAAIKSAEAAPDAGRCWNALKGGRYTLSAAPTPEGTQFGRWECYGIRADGSAAFVGGHESVILAPGDIMTCVVVYVLAPAAPSPSPSPEPPSPSPKPSEPPVDGPGQAPLMRVSSIVLGKTCSGRASNRACTCNAKVTVVASATKQRLQDVLVRGTWTSASPKAWNPILQTGTTGRKGVAAFTARRQSKGQCSFEVSRLVAKGYTYDAARSVKKSNLQLQLAKHETPKAPPKASPRDRRPGR